MSGSSWRRALVALVAGAVQAGAMVPVSPGLWAGAPTTSVWQALPVLLQAGALVALVHLLVTSKRAREAGLLGGLFALAWLTGTFWWLFISMHRYGGLPAWLAALAVLALAAFLSLYTAAAAAGWMRWGGAGAAVRILSFGAWWCLAEWARARWFTGFPWGASGYAQVDGPLAGLAPYVGVYGIGAAAAALAAALYFAWQRGPLRGDGRTSLAVALLLVTGPGLLPQAFTSAGAGLSVGLLQGNVPQEEKFESRYLFDALSWHVQTLARTEADLVVAPETAIPLLPDQLPPGLWAALSQRFGSGRVHALIGLPLGNERDGYTNSARGLGPEGDGYRYDKHHLVPFGEFIPFGFRWFVDLMHIPLGDFERGPVAAPSWPVRGARIGPNICYEDLYGEELAARFIDPATAPTVLANLSNIGWFGQTIAVGQHLQIARMRSLELQRPTVRATNTGATAVIDHRGRVTAALAPYTVGVLQAWVQGREGVTPYAWWAGRFGLWPLVVCALAAVVLAALSRQR